MSKITTNYIYKLSNKSFERLFVLLNKFAKVDDELIDLIKKKNNDNTIINAMKSKTTLIENIPYHIKIKSAKKRAYKLMNFINEANIIKKININNYLDVGCFDGMKTIEIGKILGLNSKNIFGVDVDNYAGNKIKPINGFTFNRYKQNDLLPYESESFDFITILQVLHHVKKPGKMLKEIKRVLKPNGLLFIREHDRTDKNIDKLIRLEHLLYSQLVDKIPYDIYVQNNYEKYFSRIKLEKKLVQLGFIILTTNTQTLNNDSKQTQKLLLNPTNYYEILVQLK